MATNSFRVRLCAAGFTSSQRNPRYRESVVGRSILTSAVPTCFAERLIGVHPPAVGGIGRTDWRK
jgi:hypothetical protein